jgi:hypothetical protein
MKRLNRTLETSKNQHEEGTPASSPSSPHFTLNVLAKGSNNSLIGEGWKRDKPCHVTINTRVSETIARPDIIAGQPEKKSSRSYDLQMVSGQTITIWEVLVEVTLGWSALKIWMIVTEIMEEFNLRLDVLQADDSSLDLGHLVV